MFSPNISGHSTLKFLNLSPHGDLPAAHHIDNSFNFGLPDQRF
jgi:hypothetical protein